MQVAEVRITPIAVADPPLLNAAGLHAPYALRIVLELVSEDGLSGWSEIPGSDKTQRALERAAAAIIGQDPWQLNEIFATLDALAVQDDRGGAPWDQRNSVHVRSAIEVACYDLMGNSCGRPVVDLLGGMARESVPFAAYVFYFINTKAQVASSASDATSPPKAGRRRDKRRHWMLRVSWRRHKR